MNTLQSQDAATPPPDEFTRLIPLTQGQFAIVDIEDYEYLSKLKWQASYCKSARTWYASHAMGKPPYSIQMHRLIMKAPRDMKVDHRDSNGINNRKSNLRLATSSQNSFNRRVQRNNSSGCKGVSWNIGSRSWQARITINGSVLYLGSFPTIEKAGRAYDAAARKHFGEFAWLNFPENKS